MATNQEFDTAIEMLLRPRTSEPQFLFRCADLYPGPGDTGLAIRRAGLGIVYVYEPDEDARAEYQTQLGLLPDHGDIGDSVRSAPDFDVLIANIARQKRRVRVGKKTDDDTPLEHALRFLRTKRPPGTVLWGKPLPRKAVNEIKLRRYQISEDDRVTVCLLKWAPDVIRDAVRSIAQAVK